MSAVEFANYACGCTGQKLWTILWASWLGKFPGVLMTVLLGMAGRQVGSAASGDGSQVVTLISIVIGVVATALLSFMLVRRTRALLQEEEAGLPA